MKKTILSLTVAAVSILSLAAVVFANGGGGGL